MPHSLRTRASGRQPCMAGGVPGCGCAERTAPSRPSSRWARVSPLLSSEVTQENRDVWRHLRTYSLGGELHERMANEAYLREIT